MTARQLANLAPPFTKDNAREMQAKGVAIVRERKIAKQSNIIPVDVLEHERRALIAEQIQITREVLKDKKVEHKDRAALLRALTGLLEQERIWSGRPLPGTLKPRQPDAKVQAPLPQPVVEKPLPSPVEPVQSAQVVDVTTKAIET
jgi:hypothetical protein